MNDECNYDLNSQQFEAIARTVPGGAENVQDVYTLSALQEGMLFHRLLSEDSDPYLLSTLFELESADCANPLKEALQAVIARHDALRTAVLWEGLPRPLQVVYRRAQLPFETLTLAEDDNPHERLREMMRPQRQMLDLHQAPLARLQLVADPQHARCYALLQVHHVVCDHQSLRLFVAEAMAFLQGRAQGLPASLPYREFVAAQSLTTDRIRQAEEFFRRKLGAISETTAPFGLLEVHGDGSRLREVRMALDERLARQVRAQAQRSLVSPARVFHAAWGLVVANTSGRDDVVYGTVLSAARAWRGQAGRMLGMSVNTLPLRLQLAGATVEELLQDTDSSLAELADHVHVPLTTAQRCCGIAGTTPLFTTIFNYRHNREIAADAGDSKAVRVLERGEAWTNYPIAMTVDDLGDDFLLTAQVDQRIDAGRLGDYLQEAVRALVVALEEAPRTPATTLSILPPAERQRIVEAFNATRALYPRDKLIHELFEEQVQRTPNAIAALYNDELLTYRELNEKANRLARHLATQGVAVGMYVPVLMLRSMQMLIAQLAVLKLGGAYVPIDSDMPEIRRAFMIRDCAASVLLVDGTGAAELSGLSVRSVNCADADAALAGESSDNLPTLAERALAAYVMYTSGSTGEPKGVIVEHHSVIRLVVNNGYAEIVPQDCLAHYSNPTFDASTLEVWGALLNGARVLIVPQAIVLEPARFCELLVARDVTLLYMSVGLFNQYTEALADVFVRLRYLLVGGDAVDPAAIRRVLRNSPPQHLLNAYGPTECTTLSTIQLISSVETPDTVIPIGRPLANGQAYVLNERMHVVPLQVTGEIYIGGDGVARGYLNRPELTAERFVADPFSGAPQARLYKTGDLGRWRPDGTLEYQGRNDNQVKVRGFRIELGDIEAQLLKHERVREALVVARVDRTGAKRLAAYVVALPAIDAAALPGSELRTHLKSLLPEYMVPSAFVVLDRMPLTANGKIDRRALPDPEFEAYATAPYEPPTRETEVHLADIWQALLQIDRVGRHDNFFELGGHSLLAMQVSARVRTMLSIELPVRTVFESPILRDLAVAVDELRHVQLRERIAAGGAEIEELMDLLGAMPEADVEDALRRFSAQGGGLR